MPPIIGTADSAHSELEKVVEILRSIGQENLTSPRIPRTASLKKSSRYFRQSLRLA